MYTPEATCSSLSLSVSVSLLYTTQTTEIFVLLISFECNTYTDYWNTSFSFYYVCSSHLGNEINVHSKSQLNKCVYLCKVTMGQERNKISVQLSRHLSKAISIKLDTMVGHFFFTWHWLCLRKHWLVCFLLPKFWFIAYQQNNKKLFFHINQQILQMEYCVWIRAVLKKRGQLVVFCCKRTFYQWHEGCSFALVTTHN